MVTYKFFFFFFFLICSCFLLFAFTLIKWIYLFDQVKVIFTPLQRRWKKVNHCKITLEQPRKMRQMVSFITHFRSIFHDCAIVFAYHYQIPPFPWMLKQMVKHPKRLSKWSNIKTLFFVIDLIHHCLTKKLYTALDRIE